ncbi:MAG: NYN domain-containing protein [Patescibacteria group bacterium]
MKFENKKIGAENNLAFIDGQNLYLGTTKSKNKWKVNLTKFRIYLNKKYKVKRAYYFLGCVNNNYQDLYDEIQEAGFILKFREHNTIMLGKKKGNVDSDIIFSIMKKMYRKEKFGKMILVSGDGDYKKLVDFLIEENKFEKILFPNKQFASSLYKQLTRVYYDYLENIKYKIGKKKGDLR